jgi:hypothetical protein
VDVLFINIHIISSRCANRTKMLLPLLDGCASRSGQYLGRFEAHRSVSREHFTLSHRPKNEGQAAEQTLFISKLTGVREQHFRAILLIFAILPL